MQSARLTQRADPFIQQDPNNPRYSRRLSKEQWEHLKPQVSELFYQGVSTADTLRHLQVRFNVHITRSQLDTQMRKWEFVQKNEPSKFVADPTPGESTSSEQILQSKIQEASPTSKHALPTPALNEEEPYATAEGPTAIVAYPQLRLPAYVPTIMVRRIWLSELSSAVRSPWQQRIALSERSLEILPEMARTVLILTDLKRFSEAFELLYLITSAINDVIQSDQLWGPQLVFVATTCARSAWTDEQVLIANVLVEQLCYWRDQYSDHDRNLLPDTSLIGELPSLLTLAESLLAKVSASGPSKYWSITHYSANTLREELGGGKGFCPAVRSGTKALWTKDPRDWPGDVLNSFLASYDFRRFFLEALTKVEHCICRSSVMDDLLKKQWPPDEGPSPSFAQALAGLALEYHRLTKHHASGPFPWSFILVELLDRLTVQAVATLPFVLAALIRKSNNIDNTAGTLQRCYDRLYRAAQEVRQALVANGMEENTEYEGFIEVYLDQLNSQPKTDPSLSITHSSRLLRAAAAMAGISVILNDGKLECPVEAFGVRAGRNHYGGERATVRPQIRLQQQERGLISSSHPDPTMARSYTSSVSSGFRSFKDLSRRPQSNVSLSRVSGVTASTGRWSERMSWKFSGVTSLSSNPSLRESSITDVFMDGVEEEGWEG
ncbi:hypothetical protein PV04_03418 [Phialophora macrospora]|uniref:Clr5 domain-containing protein n=1 Tax=Phialophora macrospora TaxID=1851006 RepID=A0A0D2FXN6_9EURO|nr:hypothetical protein PV04_03418 [Phialophora macrospora]